MYQHRFSWSIEIYAILVLRVLYSCLSCKQQSQQDQSGILYKEYVIKITIFIYLCKAHKILNLNILITHFDIKYTEYNI